MPIALHIFEPRYHKMIEDCLDKKAPFGVVLIKHGNEAHGPAAEPHTIGCTARIIQVRHLDPKRTNIIAIGEKRFRINRLNRNGEYLQGEVEYVSIVNEEKDLLKDSSLLLRPWVNRYIEILNEAKLLEGEIRELPNNPLELGYLAAFLLQVPTDQKQELLSTNKASEFLNSTRKFYRREVALLQNLLAEDPGQNADIVSLN